MAAWAVALGRNGTQECAHHPQCSLWEHLVGWFSFLFLFFLSHGTHCLKEDPVAAARIAQGQAQALARKVETGHGQVPLRGSTGRPRASPPKRMCALRELGRRLPGTGSHPARPRGLGGCGGGAGSVCAGSDPGALLAHVSPSQHVYQRISSSGSEA